MIKTDDEWINCDISVTWHVQNTAYGNEMITWIINGREVGRDETGSKHLFTVLRKLEPNTIVLFYPESPQAGGGEPVSTSPVNFIYGQLVELLKERRLIIVLLCGSPAIGNLPARDASINR